MDRHFSIRHRRAFCVHHRNGDPRLLRQRGRRGDHAGSHQSGTARACPKACPKMARPNDSPDNHSAPDCAARVVSP
jgi:DNA-binding IclR family transcriptional regulator